MKFNRALASVLVALLFFTSAVFAVENTWDYSVRVSASVQSSPAQITLAWPQDTNGVPSSYTIYRKAASATSWGAGTTLGGSTTTWTDTSVTAGTAYEYRIVKAAGGYTGYGYITTGINAPLVDTRGRVVLIVDNRFTTSLATEIARLESDLAGDGWTVVRHDVARTDSAANIKNLIRTSYNADPANTKAVFLLGNIPVPYSGQLNPDGHPDHIGAWPADVFYGDVDGSWTDSSVNYTQTMNTDPADAARMTNRPGDGKFDQTTIPSSVELAVGRVDLSRMPGRVTWGGPATLPSETEMLRAYLNKDHNFRHRVSNPVRRAILGDYFGIRGGEAFAASGFRSFAPLVGADNVRNLNTEYNDQRGVWMTQSASQEYLFAYGCGAGSYSSISGLGNGGNYNAGTTPELISNNAGGVFNLLMGSWLGDWDYEDSMLRAPLATNRGLVSVWSGRPHWFFHPMGLGATVGDVARLTQNNTGHYETQVNSSATRIHIALMGDPTLRLHPVVPARSLTGSLNGSTATLSWTASTDSNVVGYHVYRATSAKGPFTRLTNSPVTSTSYSDASATSGTTYMVRAVKLENTTSGSYFNASQGIFWSQSSGSTGGSTTAPAPSTDTATTSPVATTPTTTTTTDTSTTTSTTPTSTTSTTTTTIAGTTLWLDDALPAGATGTGSGGDTWNWIISNPTPVSGTKAHQSVAAAGVHGVTFNWGASMNVAAGENLVTYVYLDPASTPSSIMLCWSAGGNWEHRAYWGADKIDYGTRGTAGRYNAGALPAAGQWVRLEVPASAVGLEGQTVGGMSLLMFDGRAAFDAIGKALPGTIATTPTTSTSTTPTTTTKPESIWFDDALPSGAVASSSNGDTWNWIASSPAPASGTRAHQGNLAAGEHGHSFNWAAPLSVAAGDIVFTWVYLDPANVPAEIMLAFNAGGNWEHRVYWGADRIAYGTKGTAGRHYAGALPAAGQWVRLEVPASALALEGQSVTGMSFLAFDGRVTWDKTGLNGSASTTTAPTAPAPVVDAAAPTVAITSPTANATISGTAVAITANATDDIGVVGVQFKLDGANLGGDLTAAPFTTTLNTTSLTNGTHTITAIARDAVGNMVTASPVTVTVGNTTSSGSTTTTTPTTTTPTTTTPTTTTSSTTLAGTTIWFDDALPAGASGSGSAGENWNWVTSGPAPISGTKAHQSILAAGLHDHSFNWATAMTVNTGEVLVTYVYLDPANVPTEIMIAWNAGGNWEHRAYWGADKIGYGTNGTAGRRSMGALPAAGQWVRLEVPASAVGLEGQQVTGMSFMTFDGRATYDAVGKALPGSGTTDTSTTSPTVPTKPEVVWFDDALPAGASGSGSNGETWNWVAASPAPYSGTKAHQSIVAPRLHDHSFNWAAPLSVAAGDVLFTYVYLDPANTPTEIMLGFAAGGNWEHRAYWGADRINYGKKDTAGRYKVGALPPAGQWVRLEVPASALALEGQKVEGMSFMTFDGRATFDKTGLNGAAKAGELVSNPSGTTTASGSTSGSSTAGTSGGGTTTPSTSPSSYTPIVNALAENDVLRTPAVGDNALTILTPTTLELRRITTKQPDPAMPTEWNFVSSSGVFTAPSASEFAVTVNGQAVAVKSIGFRRRVAYAPDTARDLRIDNALIVELNGTIAEGATVEVKNASAALWPATMQFKSVADPLRFNPAIHVNQEGYVPSLPKKAMVGYYLGSLGELDLNASVGYKIVSAATGTVVHTGTLTNRRETGFNYTPAPYQKVYEADFTSVTAAGEYQLVVPGLGASLPFVINDGVAMAFTRTYALGLYHQRCGTDCKLPFTRHTHGACHMAAAEIPSPQSSYSWTWSTIASKNTDAKNNPRHTAPRLDSESAQLYPFVNKGTVNVSGGHHDAGDYSKYTINVAQLVHQLAFTADSIAGAKDLDNLGLPESGDGVSDILQEAKHEADYLAKLQDADGGFYFIVYPKTRAYESNVTPDRGDQQVVWPKNTSATAASIAALAQIASSPQFKAKYPAEAAAYLSKAKLGWQFLTNAIAKHGKDGSYQMVTFYGNNYMHDDELAWAAAELFLATGEAQYHQKLMEWFPNPADSNTFRWGWWRMSESWGNALRSYAFGARSGRVGAGSLNASYLAAAEQQIKLAADDVLKWTKQSAYGTSFPEASKHVLGAGWFFSLDRASDLAVAQQLAPNSEYVDAIVANMNYEAGTNPVNVSFITGLGLKRQREVVSQWAKNDRQKLPMPGIPVGNVTGDYSYLGLYGASGNELQKLSFPADATSGTFTPFYDRWADSWNVTAEFITVNQSRAIMSVAALAGQTAARTTAWKPASTLKIVTPTVTASVGEPLKLTLDTTGLDLAGARITWEARDQEPDYGSSYTVTPRNTGTQWVEVEVMWADGRRLFGTAAFEAKATVITWVDDAVPAGATTSADGGDGWNWVSSVPPKSGTLAHQTPAGAALRSHTFNYATNPLPLATGDTLFAWVYLDPAALPEEIMICWTDGSWEHRAYWGADKIGWGTNGTNGRRRIGDLPAGGGWVKLEVPASAVGLEGRNVLGMTFATYGGGKVTWDAAGRTSPLN